MAVAPSRDTIIALPYLGPDPPLSRSLGLPTRLALGAASVLALVRSFLFLQRASLDNRLVRERSAAVVAEIRRNQNVIHSLWRINFPVLIAVVILMSMWRSRRRGKGNPHRQQGEAYIETPMNAIMPMWLRLPLAFSLAVGIFTLVMIPVRAGTPLTALAAHRRWSALSSFCFAVFWATDYFVVVFADRWHDGRAARSLSARGAPESVEFVAPVSEYQMASFGRPAGVSWIFRTAGLVLLTMVGLGFVFAGMTNLTKDPAATLVQTMIGIVALAPVAWIGFRRVKRRA